MAHRFASPIQESLFATVLSELKGIGYTDSRLAKNYRFADYFGTGEVVASAAAFAQEPHDPNTACFAVVLSSNGGGPSLINRYRALGAPIALEVRPNEVVRWRVSPLVSDADRREVLTPDQLTATFQRHRNLWAPLNLMRAKNIVATATAGQRQLDFMDAGLLPALESHVRDKLDPLLRSVLSLARNDYRKPWHLPKVVCNAVRKSQGPWKIAACPVDLKVLCTQNFTTIWPRAPWTSRTLAAVMNGPIACAYMSTHESWMHLTKENFSTLPLPSLTKGERDTIEALVLEYERLASIRRDLFLTEAASIESRMRDVLRWIDGIILEAYRLPWDLLEELVALFRGANRPAAVQYQIDDLLSPFDTLPTLPTSKESAALWRTVQKALEEDRV